MQSISWIDWTVMLGTLLFIVAYGTWKTKGTKNIKGYLLGGNEANWWTVGLSVMATQASAITFLSVPGQAYTEGMGFVQFYFGLPLAMIVISAVFIPLYYRLKVFTAYEFLEKRFNHQTRLLTASLFLLQRGLAAGITIYAPAIILSQIVGWSLNFTIFFIGALVIVYTVSGGSKAVNQTHKQQMAVIFIGMFITFGLLIHYVGQHIPFIESLKIAGDMGKMDVIDLNFDPSNKYNIWSGIIGGFFLQLSYFGTDQSQVQRYLSGSSIRQSRLGLMFNGLFKIPMQFFILLVGVMVFMFYQFNQPPLHFNSANVEKLENSQYASEFKELKELNNEIFIEKKELIQEISANNNQEASSKLKLLHEKEKELQTDVAQLIKKVDSNAETEDSDYIFITFITDYLPVGLIGLLLAVIFCAAMSSTSAELNALASTATIDIYKRRFRKESSEMHYVSTSKWFTFLFGLFAILFAALASLFENLIEAVNILGSLFYGTILGVFLVAFFFRKVGGTAVFYSAIISQLIIIALFSLNRNGIIEIGYLWYNLIAPAILIILSLLLNLIFKEDNLLAKED